jgi:surfactin synthase thioesterase subunit
LLGNTDNPWLPMSSLRSDIRLRLFCFPYAGRGASVYSDWRDYFPSSIQVYPVQLPGRENRLGESPFKSLDSLHSMGALLSFELARLARQEHLHIAHLFLSGRSAPGCDFSKRQRYTLSDDELLHDLKEMNGSSDVRLSNIELMKLMLPTIRADFEVCERAIHRPEPPLDCPITVFGGTHDPEADEAGVRAWHRETSDVFAVHIYNGDHFFLHSCQRQLLKDLLSHLENRGVQ